MVHFSIMAKSELEDEFLRQVQAVPLLEPVREYVFARPRKYRFDFAWPEQLIAVEVQGGVFSRGRHVRGKGYEDDCEKFNLAMLIGWHVFQFTARHIRCGLAVDVVRRALDRRLAAASLPDPYALTQEDFDALT